MAISRKAMTEGLSKRKVLIPSAPVCALGQLPLISKGSLCPHPSRLRRATFPGGEGLGARIVTGGNPWKGPHQ